MSELKSLAAKMTSVMGDVATMIKNGRNDAQRYQYVTAEDVKAAIRPLLRKHGIAVFSSMVDVQRETSVNKNQTTVVTVLARMQFTLVCAETGERLTCDWYGEANDYADKAVNKAATAAEKYWLINTFLLSTTEPEADEESIEAAPPAQRCSVCDAVVSDDYAAQTLKVAGAVLCRPDWLKVKADKEKAQQQAVPI